jgi:hypothetical protein
LSMTRTWTAISSWRWPPRHGHHLLSAGDVTYRAAHLPPSHVTQLDGDEDSNLAAGSDTKWWIYPRYNTHIYSLEKMKNTQENFRSTRTCAFSPSIPQLLNELSWLQELK